jgi:hypothetical protein
MIPFCELLALAQGFNFKGLWFIYGLHTYIAGQQALRRSGA